MSLGEVSRRGEALFAYHEATKHTPERLRARPHTLDWANMPHPFRHYEGVPVRDLPADPPAPGTAVTALLDGAAGTTRIAEGAPFLSSLLFHSAAISATKAAPSGYRYALRVNPSSGNLHPTEFHFATRGAAGWPDGLYHYRVSAHMAEQRAVGGDYPAALGFAGAPLVFVLTSVAWREAWKYRDRAYRYCLHDIGHAWESLRLAARALGCDVAATATFDDAQVTALLGLDDEWPMAILALRGGVPVGAAQPLPAQWLGGTPNRLSEEIVPYPAIDRMHRAAAVCDEGPPLPPSGEGDGSVRLPRPASSAASLAAVTRRRRSALDFEGGSRTIPLDQLARLLQAAGPEGYIALYLYVHRVAGLECGVYRHWPASATLEPRHRGDVRVVAAGLSLGQDLAGNSAVTFSMIADLERAAAAHGDRGYRHALFEAGRIGQRLYLAAEAMGLQSTGIGAFFDDAVHQYLDLRPEQGQVVYHFACGYAVPDPRISPG